MNRSLYLIGLLTLSLALAGCHAPEAADDDTSNGDGGTTDGDDDTSNGDNGTSGEESTQDITLTVVDPKSEATVGEGFTMTVAVSTTQPTTSTHSGFHWSFNSTANMTDLTAANFDGASPHEINETTFPGTYTIPEWTFGDEHVGMIYVRAHTQADGMDWWGAEFEITVSAAS